MGDDALGERTSEPGQKHAALRLAEVPRQRLVDVAPKHVCVESPRNHVLRPGGRAETQHPPLLEFAMDHRGHQTDLNIET